jgi:Asp-tRNA(Asn)/Glu-tRNA(Gln) amidotransferase C subunit
MTTEEQQEKIKREAKELLDKFSKALENVELKQKNLKEEVGGFREEGEGKDCEPNFRKKMFDNAPEKKGDFLLSEKRKW